MRLTLHAVAAGAIAVLALAAAVPVLLDTSAPREIPTLTLSVSTDDTRKPLVTSTHATDPVVPARRGLAPGNPFAPPSREHQKLTPIPEPPPPPFDLPEPPLTPFTPGG